MKAYKEIRRELYIVTPFHRSNFINYIVKNNMLVLHFRLYSDRPPAYTSRMLRIARKITAVVGRLTLVTVMAGGTAHSFEATPVYHIVQGWA